MLELTEGVIIHQSKSRVAATFPSLTTHSAHDKMYSSTGISLQELLLDQGMLEPDNEMDDVLISSETYGMNVEDFDQPTIEVIPELADPEWVRKERLVGKVSCFVLRPSLGSLSDSGQSGI